MPKSKQTKKIIFFLIKLGVSGGIIFYFFSRIELSMYWSLLFSIDLKWFLPGAIFYMAATLIFTNKWQGLLKMMGIDVKFLSLFKLNLASMFYASFLPGGFLAGETVKCYKITKDNSQKTRRFFSVILDRLTGALAFAFLGTLSLILSSFSSVEIAIAYIIIFLCSIFIYVGIVNERIRLILKKLVLIIFNKIKINSEVLEKERFIRLGAINLALFWGMVFQLMVTGGLYFLILALGFQIGFLDLIWINALVSAATFIPVSLLGIGLRDVSLVYLLGLFDFSTEAALGIATLVVFVLILRGIPGGLIELYNFFQKKRQI